MNLYLVSAAALTALLGLLHTIMGEALILVPLLKREVPKIRGDEFIVRRTLRFAWHTTSLFWWGIAALLVVLAFGPLSARETVLLRVLLGTFGIAALLSLIASHGKHFSWYVFTAIAVLIFLGAR